MPGRARSFRWLASGALWLFVASVPLDVWVLENVGSISVVTGALLAVSGLIAVAAKARVRRFTPAHLLMTLFVLWSLATYFWSRDPDATLQRAVTNAQLLLSTLLFWQFCADAATADRLKLAYVAGCAVAAVATIIRFARGDTSFVSETRYVASGFDPNDLGVTLAIGIPFAWWLFCRGGGWNRWCGLIYVPLSLLAIALTASRGAAIAATSAVLLLLKVGTRRGRYRAAGFILLVGTIAAAMTVVPAGAWDRLFTIREQVEGGTLGQRLPLWRAGLDGFLNRWLVGNGSASFGAMVEGLVDEGRVAHNTYVSVAAETGSIGFIMFCGILLTINRDSRRLTEPIDRWLVYSATIVWALGVSSLTWEYRKPTWILFSLLIAHSRAHVGDAARARSKLEG
jgi:hypothetical protein